MDRNQKEQLVSEFNSELGGAECVVLVHYKGLDVAEMTDLRKQIRGSGAKFAVIKNRLASLAVRETKFDMLSDKFSGPTAVAYSEDPVAAAKTIVDFSKDNEKLIIIGGALGSQEMDEKDIAQLAKMPSLDELRARLIGMINTPATRIARIAKEPAGQIARVIKACSDK